MSETQNKTSQQQGGNTTLPELSEEEILALLTNSGIPAPAVAQFQKQQKLRKLGQQQPNNNNIQVQRRPILTNNSNASMGNNNNKKIADALVQAKQQLLQQGKGGNNKLSVHDILMHMNSEKFDENMKENNTLSLQNVENIMREFKKISMQQQQNQQLSGTKRPNPFGQGPSNELEGTDAYDVGNDGVMNTMNNNNTMNNGQNQALIEHLKKLGNINNNTNDSSNAMNNGQNQVLIDQLKKLSTQNNQSNGTNDSSNPIMNLLKTPMITPGQLIKQLEQEVTTSSSSSLPVDRNTLLQKLKQQQEYELQQYFCEIALKQQQDELKVLRELNIKRRKMLEDQTSQITSAKTNFNNNNNNNSSNNFDGNMLTPQQVSALAQMTKNNSLAGVRNQQQISQNKAISELAVFANRNAQTNNINNKDAQNNAQQLQQTAAVFANRNAQTNNINNKDAQNNAQQLQQTAALLQQQRVAQLAMNKSSPNKKINQSVNVVNSESDLFGGRDPYGLPDDVQEDPYGGGMDASPSKDKPGNNNPLTAQQVSALMRNLDNNIQNASLLSDSNKMENHPAQQLLNLQKLMSNNNNNQNNNSNVVVLDDPYCSVFPDEGPGDKEGSKSDKKSVRTPVSPASSLKNTKRTVVPPPIPGKIPNTYTKPMEKCEVPGCLLLKESKIKRDDEFGKPGNRCIKHGGGQPCSVEGCLEGVQGKSAVEADDFGPYGLRCPKHGGDTLCTAYGCLFNAAGMVAIRDHWGPPGKRCRRHGFKGPVEEKGLRKKV